ncbi:MAG TPA: hypothetical protein EYH20_03825 [Leucothrix sp.]|nr:hypothetical protein [Leucothrix sp.]
MKFSPIILKLIVTICFLVISINAQATTKTELLQSKINALVAEELGKINRQMGVVINLSGRQRMLTQKMSKEMLLIYHEIDVKKNRTNLGKSALMFAKTLKGLINGDETLNLSPTRDKDILKQMDVVSGLWLSFSKNVLPAISGEKIDLPFIEKVARENLPLLKEMNKAVNMYEKAAGSDLNDLAAVVNLSGRQRMLTQKMTKEFLLIAAQVNEKANKDKLEKTIALFDHTLKGLRNGDPSQGLSKTTEPIVLKQLTVIETLWLEYKLVLINLDISKKGLKKVAKLNMPLLKEMNSAVKMYEVLSDNG